MQLMVPMDLLEKCRTRAIQRDQILKFTGVEEHMETQIFQRIKRVEAMLDRMQFSTRLEVTSTTTLKQGRELQRVEFHSINSSDNNSSKCIVVQVLVQIHQRFQLKKERIPSGS